MDMQKSKILKNTVYLSNLSYRRDKTAVKALFTPYGQVKWIKIVVEPTTNQSRGMAFVEMMNDKEAKLAIVGLDQKLVDGRTLKAKYATALKPESMSKKSNQEPKEEISFLSKQLAKKTRNAAKRKSNPLVFKAPTKR